jgi:predicted TPR repeat methyltransferase
VLQLLTNITQSYCSPVPNVCLLLIQFRNISNHLIGVDLSEAILKEAEKVRPKMYDERIAGDLVEVFRAKQPVSLIIAADSYIYFGDLVPLFESMEESLVPGGFAAFTLENVSKVDEVRQVV